MSPKTPAVSVLMPVYNRERLVSDAIQSIQNQTFKEWQLIILDDGSADQTEQICRAFARVDSRIAVYRNSTNLGVGESRNRLLELAAGEFIAIQDSDDISLPDRLMLEFEFLKKNPDVGLVSGVAAFIDDEGNILRYYPEPLYEGILYPQDRKQMVRGLFVSGCNIANSACMFRHSLLEKMQRPFGDFKITDDQYFFLQVAHQTSIWGIPQVLVKMRRGQSHQHVWKDTLAGIREVRRCLDLIYQQYGNHSDSYITRGVYRKALSASMVTEARYFGGVSGWPLLLKAFAYDPWNRRAWSSLREFSIRGFKKLRSTHLLQMR